MILVNVTPDHFQAIRSMIVSGHVRSGMPLQPVHLASVLNSSFIPVRESLWRLHENGLADYTKNVGFSVKGYDLKEQLNILKLLREIYDSRLGPALTRPICGDRVDECARRVRANIDICHGGVSEHLVAFSKLHDLIFPQPTAFTLTRLLFMGHEVLRAEAAKYDNPLMDVLDRGLNYLENGNIDAFIKAFSETHLRRRELILSQIEDG